MNEDEEFAKALAESQQLLKEEQEKIDQQSTGFGDTIKKVTDFLHIPQCGGCKERQKALNKMFPYKPKD
tara:strand:+ start:236 stop:442 length:207 start_codon:yes stop_codon:yes gene_type:complete